MAQILNSDTYSTPIGEVTVIPVIHAAVMLQHRGMTIYLDPYGGAGGDYVSLPKADLVIITHEHYDHLDKKILRIISKPGTEIISTSLVAQRIAGVRAIGYGDTVEWNGIGITAVPAYNAVRERSPGVKHHTRGEVNGYILNFGGFRIYIAGDTEFIPEMKSLGNIEVAFLPKMFPYTMDGDEFIEAAKAISPKVLYPYHYLKIDKEELRRNLPGITIK